MSTPKKRLNHKLDKDLAKFLTYETYLRDDGAWVFRRNPKGTNVLVITLMLFTIAMAIMTFFLFHGVPLMMTVLCACGLITLLIYLNRIRQTEVVFDKREKSVAIIRKGKTISQYGQDRIKNLVWRYEKYYAEMSPGGSAYKLFLLLHSGERIYLFTSFFLSSNPLKYRRLKKHGTQVVRDLSKLLRTTYIEEDGSK